MLQLKTNHIYDIFLGRSPARKGVYIGRTNGTYKILTRTLEKEEAVKGFLRAYKKAIEYYNRAREGKEPERDKRS